MKTRAGVTSGATLVLVVLLTMLLLAGILAATLRLSLGSRQNTADQRIILQTQYAAESGISLAQSRLKDIQEMLTYTPARLNSAGSTPVQALSLPRNVRLSAVQDWMKSLCGTSTWTSISEGKEKNDPGYFDPGPSSTVDTDDALYPSAQACKPTGWVSASQFVLFSRIVTDAAYTILPVGERPEANEAAEQTFWYNLFNQNKTDVSGLATATTNPSIVRILKLTSSHYRVFISNLSVSASASKGTGVRRTITGQPSQDSTWWFDVNQPGFLDAVVQTDYQTSLSGSRIDFTTSTNFQGPLKTNDVFSFVSNAGFNNPTFSGQISSAGCGPARTVTADQITCVRNPGVKVNSDTAQRNFVGATDLIKSNNIKAWISGKNVNINYNGTEPNYASEFQPFPEAALIQENAAQGKDEDGNMLPGGQRGLTLTATQIGVQVFAGDADGNALTSYDSSAKKWNEPSPTYQYIKPITAAACTTAINVSGCTYTFDPTISYRVDRDGNMQQKGIVGNWTTIAGSKFNGVVYKTGKMTVVGPQPARSNYSATPPEAQARPAVASFSGLTLAATDDVTVRSDLALSQTPCRYNEYSTLQITPACGDRQNVLGVFSSNGSVIVGKQVPNNGVLQAAVMASKEEVTVDGYTTGGSRGALKFTGSMVEKYYGANGTYNPSCSDGCRNGYERDYSYDKRFSEGLTPPFYPTAPKWSFEDASNRNVELSNVLWKQGDK